jgi:hypothetical protein
MLSDRIPIQMEPEQRILRFNTLNNKKMFGIYTPTIDTIENILLSFFKNYSCKDVHNTKILFKLNGEKYLNDFDKNLTLSELGITDYVANVSMSIKQNEQYTQSISDSDINEKIKDATDVFFVRTLTGKTLTIPLSENLLVAEVKSIIQDREGIPPDQQRLTIGSTQLEDSRILLDYNIKSCTIIHLVLRLRGGMYHETSGKNGNFEQLNDCIFRMEVIKKNQQNSEECKIGN